MMIPAWIQQWRSNQSVENPTEDRRRKKKQDWGMAMHTHSHTHTGLHTSVRQPSSQENPWLTFTQIHRSHAHTRTHTEVVLTWICAVTLSHINMPLPPCKHTHTLQRKIVTRQTSKALRTHIVFFLSILSSPKPTCFLKTFKSYMPLSFS